jgi:RNA polymerase sigma-70 factor (ECF subfamily)
MIRFDENSDLTDAELLALNALTHDNEPLGTLFIRYMPLVYGVCLKYLRDSGEATDAVAAIYEEVARQVNRYEIREWRTWLYSVTKNYCLSRIKHRGGIAIEISENFMEFEALDTLLESEREIMLSAMEECIKKLPDKQQTCIVEFYFNRKSYADIVQEQRIAIGGVKSCIQNGRRNLKLCIEKQGIGG